MRKAAKSRRVVTVRLEEPMIKQIQREAKSEGLSASAVIRRALMRVYDAAASAS